MSYLQDRKTKRKKTLNIILGVLFLLILFYFRTSIFFGLSYFSSTVFRPVLGLGNNVGSKFSGLSSFFISKNSLLKENEDLKSQLLEKDASTSNYNALLDENEKMKEILGRKKDNTSMILSAILEKPNQSPYDTLIIDVGANKNIKQGKVVFALGNIPIGHVSAVYPYSSKVTLFSTWGEKTEVVVEDRDVFMSVTGRGGGNFEMIVPRDFVLGKGTTVILPGIIPYVVGIVETIISDPRDAFTKALLVSPVNIQELKFVQVQM